MANLISMVQPGEVYYQYIRGTMVAHIVTKDGVKTKQDIVAVMKAESDEDMKTLNDLAYADADDSAESK